MARSRLTLDKRAIDLKERAEGLSQQSLRDLTERVSLDLLVLETVFKRKFPAAYAEWEAAQ